MAGRKQHFIQRLLLRGFSFDADHAPCHVWVYRHDGKTFAPAVEGYGAERDFYGDPSESELDAQVTSIENEKFNTSLNDLRDGCDRPVDAEQATELAIHVFFRSKHYRSMQAAGLEPIVAHVRYLLRSDDMVEKLVLSPVGVDFRKHIPHFRQLVEARVKERRPQIQAYLDRLVGEVAKVVASNHKAELSARLSDSSGTRRAQYAALQWRVVNVQDDLVLGDSVVFVELADGTFKPVTEPNDVLAAVWLPIASNRVLAGCPPGQDPHIDPARVNRGAAACSFDAFCAKEGPDKHRPLIPRIRTSTFRLDEKAMERIATETLAKFTSESV